MAPVGLIACQPMVSASEAVLKTKVLRNRRTINEWCFAGALRIGIGIDTDVVIAGTIGGGSFLESTPIGDNVNVAARVKQLTKTTGHTIPLTH